MKKINTLLYILLAGFVALFATDANAQTTWDFSTMSDADKAACQADDNWLLGSDRWCYVGGALDNAPLVANGTELDYAKGLTFTAGAPSEKVEGKAKVRCNFGSSRLELNGNGVKLTINNLKVGQVVSVKCLTGKNEEARGLDATNLSGTQGFGESAISAEEMTCTGTVAADGDVTLTTLVGGMYIYSISVSAAQQGGGDEPDEPVAGDDHSVSGNTTVNQMRLTVGSDIKYYNTDDVKVAFNKAEGTVIVTPVDGDWVDTYTRSVSHIDFAVAEDDTPSGEVSEGEVKIKSYDGWNEAAYIEWDLINGASSYVVYVKGGSVGDEYKKIDYQLVRDYGTYGRADVLGLSAGTYSIKIVPVFDGKEDNSKSSAVEGIEVVNHDRIGFSFVNGKAPGAYNNNGTLKNGAIVIYVTNENKDDVTNETIGSSYKGLTGILEGIRIGIKDGELTRPVDIRIIGQITDPSGLDKGDLLIDMASASKSASYAGLTIEGVGNDAVIDGWGIRLKNTTSVEIRNLAFMNCDSGEGDNIGLQQGNDYTWVHHCDMFYGNAGSDADQIKGDGSIDVKKSDHVTISYNHLWDNGKTGLLGLSGENDGMYVTYHHNWFDHVDSRCPRARLYSAHVYNNYYDGVAKYGVGASQKSSIFVENNYFRNTDKPILTKGQGTDHEDNTFDDSAAGMVKSYGNIFAEKSSNFSYITHEDNPTSFDAYEASNRDEQVPSSYKSVIGGSTYNNFDTDASIMYDYKPDDASEVVSVVTGKYGAGRLQHGDFQWNFDNAKEDHNYDVIPELKSAITNYKTSLKGIFDGDNTSSGEQGSEGGDEPVNPNPGGDEGEDNPDEPETPVVTEGDIYASFVGGKLQSNNVSIFTEGSSAAKADKSGTMTINGTAYSEGLKMNSSGELTVTPTEDMTMTLYFDKRDDYTDGEIGLAINGEDIAGVATAAGDGYTITVDVKAGTSYKITRGGSVETCLYYVALESKNGGDVTDPDEGGEEPVDPNPDEGEDPDTPVTGETITCNFDGKAASNSIFVATKDGAEPSWTSKNGPVTVGGVTYTNGVKMESATNIAFSIDTPMTLNIYFTKAEKDPADIEVDDVKIEGLANDNYFVATTSIEAGDHNITRGSKETQIYLIELVPAGK